MKDIWVARFLSAAREISAWSKDPSTKVGAVIVEPNSKRIVSLGFNGPPKFVTDEYWLSNRELKIASTLHAELNAAIFAREPLSGCSLFCTHPPCCQCMAVCIQVGITEIYYSTPTVEFALRWSDSFRNASELATDAGLRLFEVEP